MTTDADQITAAPAKRPPVWASRGFWVRQITSWHWICAAIALIAMTGFAITGITLNHASDIRTHPVTRHDEAVLPAPLQAELGRGSQGALPPHVAAWLDQKFAVHSGGRDAEWSADEVYLTLTRPGGDASISIDRRSGAVTHEDTWRGWVSFFNDLHKGRNAGPYWTWFIDIFAGACVVFCLTGFALLWLKAHARSATWPLIAAGIAIPLLLAIFLMH